MDEVVPVHGEYILGTPIQERNFCNFTGRCHKEKNKTFAIFNHSCAGQITPHVSKNGELSATFLLTEYQLTQRMKNIQKVGGDAGETIDALRALRRLEQ